jgi:transcriptional regulator with XRE-family HTH domain
MSEEADREKGPFGSLLRHYRGTKRLTQEELAERSGLNVQAISMLERGVRRTPRSTTVEVLAEALKLDVSQRELLVAAAQRQRGLGVHGGRVRDDHGRKLAPRAGVPPNTPVAFVVCDQASIGTTPVPRARPPDRRPVHMVLGLLAAMLVIMSTIVIALAWSQRPVDPPSASTLPRCASSHLGACWAATVAGGTNRGVPCAHQVPLFLRSGGLMCLNGNDLVEITCYYKGGPIVDADQFQDHVVMVNAGRLSVVGHIPDRFVDLGNKAPPAAGIPPCGP